MKTQRLSRTGDITPFSYPPRMPPKRSEIIAQRIVRDIQSNDYVAGDPLLTEPELCESYQVGRSTLREALRLLELQGVIEIRPGRGGGPVVSSPNSRHLASTMALLMQFSKTTFRTVVEARSQLEPSTASMCAVNGDAAILTALEDSVERMRGGLNDEEIFLSENQLFHSLVAEGAGNAIISYIINSLEWIIDGSQLGVKYTTSDRRSVLKAHGAILRGIIARDADQARAAMKQHMDDTAKYFEKNFPDVMSKVVTWELYGL